MPAPSINSFDFATGDGVGSVTDSINIPGGLTNSLLLVIVHLMNGGDEVVDDVTWNGVSLTRFNGFENSNDGYVDIWYAVSPESGTHNLVVDFDSTIEDVALVGHVLITGVDPVTPLSGYVQNVAQNGNATPSVTVSCAVDDLIIGALAGEDVDGMSSFGDMTELWSQEPGANMTAAAGYKVADATSEAISWTLNNNDHRGLAGFAVKQASAPTTLEIFVHDCDTVISTLV